MMYSRAAAEGRALFVTILGESHDWMMLHLRPMRFFNQSLIPDQVNTSAPTPPLRKRALKCEWARIRDPSQLNKIKRLSCRSAPGPYADSQG
jgi:hypothetical protein